MICCAAKVRERAGRAEDPSVVVLDTQPIRAANHVPAATGEDAGKKVPGRKRGLAVDALGLIIAVVVTDIAIGVRLLDKIQVLEENGTSIKLRVAPAQQ